MEPFISNFQHHLIAKIQELSSKNKQHFMPKSTENAALYFNDDKVFFDVGKVIHPNDLQPTENHDHKSQIFK